MQTIVPTKSVLKRRRLDSCGKRGKVETLEAQPKRLNCLPPESELPQRKEASLYAIESTYYDKLSVDTFIKFHQTQSLLILENKSVYQVHT
ncbi:hypothetical protein BACI349Y_580018 [Bacillus sp. 349Y]|uniref:hypothetical protein n=1 Tax=Rossellomorea marisflavi TaxID=189381 RepID=UPI0012F1534C|nr:hypothetical protein BACI349Y_580018 [Bacillus sp. 349Y]